MPDRPSVFVLQSAAFAPPTPRQPTASTSGSDSDVEPAVESSLQAVTDEIAASMDPEIERKREEAARAAWGDAVPSSIPESPVEATPDATAAPVPVCGGAASLGDLSMEELQAELERRKQAVGQ